MPPEPDPIGALLSLPPPRLPAEALKAQLSSHWGLEGRLFPLTSERDLNHRLATRTGRFTVKLANPAEPPAMTDFQTRAFLHVADADPTLPVPRVLPTRKGALWADLPEGRLRVLTWLDGTPAAHHPGSPALSRDTGAALARLARALSLYDHPAADHVLLWDIRQTPRLAALLPALPDPTFRAEATALVTDFDARIAPVLSRLPTQVCHADFNPHNLLTDPADPDRISGIIDFGDMVRTPRICDLAVACSYHLTETAPLDRVTALLQGYTAHQPLERAEVALLFDLITARMVATLTITAWRAARYPDNAAYILRNAPSARAGIAALATLGRDAATRAFAAACGHTALP